MGKISEFFNFDNIGCKIKNLAKWSCWITILLIWVAAPIAFIALVADDWTAYLCWIPLVGAIVGPVLVWVESWLLYAFGEFVEDIHAIRDKEGMVAKEKAKCKTDEKENTTKEQEGYYILKGETKAGPYDIKELSEKVAQGILKPYTYVWKKGMPKWVSAKDEDGLSDLFTSPSSSNE